MTVDQHTYSRREVLAGLTVFITNRTALGAPLAAKFQIFDALLHHDKPDLRLFGLQPLPAVANIWRQGASQQMLDEIGVNIAINRLPIETTAIFLDIEYWLLLGVSNATRNQTINKFMKVAELIRKRRPAIKFGFYNALPAHAYWPLATTQFPKETEEWHLANIALQPVAELVDFIFPSLYTYYADHPGWLRYAAALLEAAHAYRKPVYPFLWFEYHDSNRELHNKEIAIDAWRDQLRFCRSHADGVVLWGGYRQRWNPNANWWQLAQDELGLKTQ